MRASILWYGSDAVLLYRRVTVACSDVLAAHRYMLQSCVGAAAQQLAMTCGPAQLCYGTVLLLWRTAIVSSTVP